MIIENKQLRHAYRWHCRLDREWEREEILFCKYHTVSPVSLKAVLCIFTRRNGSSNDPCDKPRHGHVLGDIPLEPDGDNGESRCICVETLQLFIYNIAWRVFSYITRIRIYFWSRCILPSLIHDGIYIVCVCMYVYIYIYIYIYVCVYMFICVCVCVCVWSIRASSCL